MILTDKQSQILKGLEAIGPEIEYFYLDLIEISQGTLKTKSYLMAHLMREIDCGLLDIFNPNNPTNKPIKEDKEKETNFQAFLNTFDLSENNNISKRYKEIREKFPKLAHRHGAYKEPRSPEEAIEIWNKYEDILYKLIGNYFSLSDRVEKLTNQIKPRKNTLKVLPNLLKNKALEVYFFSTLKHKKWLKPLYDQGYFSGENEPQVIETEEGGIITPRWPILTYLDKISEENYSQPEKEISTTISKIINEIITYRNKKKIRIKNESTEYFLFKALYNLPEVYLKLKHFNFIRKSLRNNNLSLIRSEYGNFLDRLLGYSNERLLIKATKIIFDFTLPKNPNQKIILHKNETETVFNNYEINPLFNSYFRKRIITQYGKRLIASLGIKLILTIREKIDKLIELNNINYFSYDSIPEIKISFNDGDEDGFDKQLLYFFCNIYLKLPDHKLEEETEKLLETNHSIYQRLAFSIIDNRYNLLKKLFWDYSPNPCTNDNIETEITKLICNHAKEFSEKEVTKLIDWFDDSHLKKEKSRWFSLLKENGGKRIKDGLSTFQVQSGNFQTPKKSNKKKNEPKAYTEEDLSNLRINQLSRYLGREIVNQFNYSFENIFESIKQKISSNPGKYIKAYSTISKTNYYFKLAWLGGISEGWTNLAPTDQIKTSNLLYRLISTNFSKKRKKDEKKQLYHSSLSLIQEVFSPNKDLPANEIIRSFKNSLAFIFNQDTSTLPNDSKLWKYALKMPRVIALDILLSLTENLKKKTGKWDPEIKKIFSDTLIKNDNFPELFFIGSNFQRLYNIEKEWVAENFNLIFQKDNQESLRASLGGYLFSHTQQCQKNPLDSLLLQNKIFTRAVELLNNNFLTDFSFKKNLVTHICNNYLLRNGNLDVKSPLMQGLIRSKDNEIFDELIWYFSSQIFPRDGLLRKKIKPLWCEIVDYRLKNKVLSKNDKNILSGCCKWVYNIPKIDDDLTKVLKFSVQYIQEADLIEFLIGLRKHLDHSVEYVSEILVKLSKVYRSHSFPTAEVVEMIQCIYDRGLKNKADEICLELADKDFNGTLRKVYDKYNS